MATLDRTQLDRVEARDGREDGVADPAVATRSATSPSLQALPRRARRAIVYGPGALSRTPPGCRVLVERIVFEGTRARCEEQDVRPGTVLMCIAWLPDAVLVKLPTGDTARIETELAEFVSVRPAVDGRGADGRPPDAAGATTRETATGEAGR